MSVEVRKIETEYNETGVGQSNRTDVTYELGTEIDGAWIRFASVPGASVDALVARARETQANAPQNPSAQQSQAGQPQTMENVTPTPAPQAEAASTSGGAPGGTETQEV